MMRSLLLCCFVALPLWAQNPTPPKPELPQAVRAPVPEAPELGVKSYFLIDDATGQVLAEKEADLRVEPASITKVMAAYVLFEELAAGRLKLDDTVQISENAWKMGLGGSRMFLPAGSSATAEQLILGMIVQSGNDATVALAEHIAGTEQGFVAMMNDYAGRLGMANSHFTNSPGLPDTEHYSTARDLATLARAVIDRFPEYYKWYSVPEFSFNNIRQYNRNTLLQRDPTVDGMKTGHTASAGYCLVSSAKREDMRLIAVVMGSASERSRADESQALLNYGFRFFEHHQLYPAGHVLREQQVFKGTVSTIKLGVKEGITVVIPRGYYDLLEAKLEVPATLIAPLAQGAVLGKVQVRMKEKLIVEVPVIALDAAPEAGVFGRMWDGMRLWWAE